MAGPADHFAPWAEVLSSHKGDVGDRAAAGADFWAGSWVVTEAAAAAAEKMKVDRREGRTVRWKKLQRPQGQGS